MSELIKSWVLSANDADCSFPLNNLPYGVFSHGSQLPHCGIAIGDQILDVTMLETEGLISVGDVPVFDVPFWNVFMETGADTWAQFRKRLIDLLSENGNDALYSNADVRNKALVPMDGAQLHMPFKVSEYTDFYAGKHHAFNVGSMFRDPENALPPNWLHIPIGYNGRASSVVVSGTDVRRPWGQLMGPNDTEPTFAPSQRFDIELEMGAIVGTPSNEPITVEQADRNIFGYVLLNDWSARDIQKWEYQPLGPFQAKATATTISPWIVTKEALEPFRTSTPEREKELLPYLREPKPMLYDIALDVSITPSGANSEQMLSSTNYSRMYYSSAQQLAHHTTSGCPMRAGDLLGSGTISGPTKNERGSMLELCWGGKEPIQLENAETRTFLNDNDTITLSGHAQGDGYMIGFGKCVGTIIPALDTPFKSNR
jgi:fumarylacetoacetase